MTIRNENLELAFAVAEKYCTEPRRDGTPSMGHIRRVVDILNSMGYGWNQKILTIGALHDIVEDCHDKDPEDDSATIELIGFGYYVMKGVQTLTHPPEEKYCNYIKRIIAGTHTGAVIVKIADIIDNLTSEPLPASKARYKKSLPALIKRWDAQRWDRNGCDIPTQRGEE
jgi:(p)ppGpp synthase/HD superfamily hydrolase